MDDKNKTPKSDPRRVSLYTQEALGAMYRNTKTPQSAALPEKPYYEVGDFDLKTADIDKLISYMHMNIIKLHARLDIIERRLEIPPGRFEPKA